jgi:hypothetical protein
MIKNIFRIYFFLVVIWVLNIKPFLSYLRIKLKLRTRLKKLFPPLFQIFWNNLRFKLKLRTRLKKLFSPRSKVNFGKGESFSGECDHSNLITDKVVLLVIGSLEAGGAERQWANLAIGLKKIGYQPILVIEKNIQLASEWILRDLCDNEIDIISLSDFKERFEFQNFLVFETYKHEEFNDSKLSQNLSILNEEPIFKYYVHIMNKFKDSIIIAALDRSIIFSYYSNKISYKNPFVAGLRSLSPSFYSGVEETFYKQVNVFKKIYGYIAEDLSVFFVGNSAHVKDSYLDYFKNISSETRSDIKIIPNQTYISEIANQISHSSQIKCCNDFHVLGIMRFSFEKNPLYWLRIAKALFQNLNIPIHFILIGRGQLKGEIDLEVIRLRKIGMKIDLKEDRFILKYLHIKGIVLITSLTEGHSNLIDELQCYNYPTYTVFQLDQDWIQEEIEEFTDINEFVLKNYESPKENRIATPTMEKVELLAKSYSDLLKK